MKNLLCVVTFAVCSSVCANAQTIADVARKERAQRPPAQTTVTFTNANLRKKAVSTTEEKRAADPQAPAPATATAAAAAPAAPAAAQPPASTDTGDEKSWREKFEAARTDIRRAENQVAVAQLELNSANKDYLTRSYDPDGRGLRNVAAGTQKLADANLAVAAAKAKLSQLEDDLRRAGAPAGWGR